MWLGFALVPLGILLPARAAAEGGLDAAFTNLEYLFAEFLAALLGVAATIAALRSRSRGVWLFALAVAAGNAITGAIVLATSRLILPYALPPSLQVVLGVVAGPCLVVWRQCSPLPGESMADPRRSPRWLVLWILLNTLTGLLAHVAVRSVFAWAPSLITRWGQAHALEVLLIAIGLGDGILFGAVQWVLLRDFLGVNASWIVLTALGSAAAGALISWLPPYPALSLPLSGAIVAAAVWPLLRTRLDRSWLWVLLGALLGLLQAPLASLEAGSRGGLVVLGWLLNAFKALVLGVALQRLARGRSTLS